MARNNQVSFEDPLEDKTPLKDEDFEGVAAALAELDAFADETDAATFENLPLGVYATFVNSLRHGSTDKDGIRSFYFGIEFKVISGIEGTRGRKQSQTTFLTPPQPGDTAKEREQKEKRMAYFLGDLAKLGLDLKKEGIKISALFGEDSKVRARLIDRVCEITVSASESSTANAEGVKKKFTNIRIGKQLPDITIPADLRSGDAAPAAQTTF